MGYTKRQLVDAALEEIGLDPVEFSVTPGELQKCLRRLDAMIATWDGEGIPLSYPMPTNPEESDIDKESNIPDWAYEAVYLNLAVLIAPTFGKNIFSDTKKSAIAAKNIARRKTFFITQQQYPNTFPVGSGNKYWIFDYNRFFTEDQYTTEIENP